MIKEEMDANKEEKDEMNINKEEAIAEEMDIDKDEMNIKNKEEENGEKLKNIIESFLFVSHRPVALKRISEVIEIKEEKILKLLEQLRDEYKDKKGSLKIREVAGGWEISTKEEYGQFIKKFLKKEITFTLSPPALETLSIIAYKQPITKHEINKIRGVDVSGSLGTLLRRKLIKISGRKKVAGRPIIYSTTQDFLRYFGLRDITEIPQMEEK